MGEGGAPAGGRVCLPLLADDYLQQATVLTTLGFNGDLLDLKPLSVVNSSIPDKEEAQIQHLLATGKETKTGALFKASVNRRC